MSTNLTDEEIQKTLSKLQSRYDILRDNSAKMGSALVAFSGGIDSMTLLKVIHEELGSKCAGAFVRSCLTSKSEFKYAEEFCKDEGIELYVVSFDPFKTGEFAENNPDRCYLCKKAIFSKLKMVAADKGFEHLCDGSNADDVGDCRPGLKALEELGVESPLIDVGMTKDEVRVLAMSLGIDDWDKPSNACFASRIPTGDAITREKIKMIEKAEQVVRDAGFLQLRVRMHGDLARIEVGEDELERIGEFEQDEEFLGKIREVGFNEVEFDPKGYRQGGANA